MNQSYDRSVFGQNIEKCSEIVYFLYFYSQNISSNDLDTGDLGQKIMFMTMTHTFMIPSKGFFDSFVRLFFF